MSYSKPKSRLMINALYLIVTVGAVKTARIYKTLIRLIFTSQKFQRKKRFMTSNLYQYFILFFNFLESSSLFTFVNGIKIL